MRELLSGDYGRYLAILVDRAEEGDHESWRMYTEEFKSLSQAEKDYLMYSTDFGDFRRCMKKRRVNALKFFLEHGGDPNYRYKNERYAVKSTLLEDAIPHPRDNCSDEEKAVSMELMRLLIKHGANVNPRYIKYSDEWHVWTPLTRAIQYNDFDIVNLLLDSGADVNYSGIKGGGDHFYMPLHTAAGEMNFCDVDMVKLLLDRGADINALDFRGMTPLYHALILRLDKPWLIVEELVKRGADILIRHKKHDNMTALDIIRKKKGTYLTPDFMVHVETLASKSILGGMKPKLVKSTFEILLLIGGTIGTLFDIASDIVVMVIYFSKEQYAFFSLAALFVLIPYSIQVLSYKRMDLRMLAVLMLSGVYEAVNSMWGGVETSNFILMKLLESGIEGCPSALLQLYVLLAAALNDDSGLLVQNTDDMIIVFSLIISMSGTAWCLAAYLSDQSQRTLLAKYILFPLYHVCEELFRLVTLCALFLALGSYGFLMLLISLLFRAAFVYRIFKVESMDKMWSTKRMTRLCLSVETDCVWCSNRAITLAFQASTTVEGIIYVLLLNLSGAFEDKSDYQIYFLAVCCGTWILKIVCFYNTYLDVSSSEGLTGDRRDQIPATPVPTVPEEYAAYRLSRMRTTNKL